VPANLSNVVAIAAGKHHALALKSDGKVVAWGSNTSGETNVPAGLGSRARVCELMALSNVGFAEEPSIKGSPIRSMLKSTVHASFASFLASAIYARFEGSNCQISLRSLWLTSPAHGTDGTFQWSVQGIPNRQVGVQRSTNLLDWEDWQTTTLGATATVLDDGPNAGVSRRFYRAAVR